MRQTHSSPPPPGFDIVGYLYQVVRQMDEERGQLLCVQSLYRVHDSNGSSFFTESKRKQYLVRTELKSLSHIHVYSYSRSSSCALRHKTTLNSLLYRTLWAESTTRSWGEECAWGQTQCLCLHLHVGMTVKDSPAPTHHPFQLAASSLLCR